MTKKPDFNESAKVVAGMLVASVIKTSQEVRHPHIWRMILCACTDMFEEDPDKFAFLVMRDLIDMLENNDPARTMRHYRSDMFARYALDTEVKAMRVVRSAREDTDPKDHVSLHQKVGDMPDVLAEIRAFEDASKILGQDSRSQIEQIAEVVRRGKAMQQLEQISKEAFEPDDDEPIN